MSQNNELLKIEDLRVSAEEKEILRGLNLSMGPGEVHVIMGPNGAGKSTLGHAIMGNPSYTVTGGQISFKGDDLLEMDVTKRAQSGLFMTFQDPVEIPGITLANFLRSAVSARGEKISMWNFRKELKKKMQLLQINETYMDRELNVGFSGGEKKKAEILQMLMINPSLAILDETDSGLDVDAVKIVSLGVEEFMKSGTGSLLIITHSTRILDALHVDRVHVLARGRIVAEGDASIIDDINNNGFEKYIAE
ncbi:MAG: Fe-S cluster assembly ATPase SufC [Lachnospiraceae bacterium]|nr:Fe-S cluster assembly ATPase SufC [Lachnospiraceae bacterium]